MRCEDLPGHPDFRRLDDIAGLEVDLRYAGTDNFVGHVLYGGLDCRFVHRQAGAALERCVAWLAQHAPGHRLRVLDALRPHRVQVQLWHELAPALRAYLADPARGSIHSFGMAVDVTLLDPLGRELDMGAGFDEMTERSHPAKEAEHLASGVLSAQQVTHRQLLRDAMAAGGFQGIRNEWWHFDLGDRAQVRAGFVRVE
jgi:D-alanyl-D-alanine dipeptidase